MAPISRQPHNFLYFFPKSLPSLQWHGVHSIQWHDFQGPYSGIHTVRSLLFWHEFRDKILGFADDISWNSHVALYFAEEIKRTLSQTGFSLRVFS